MKDGFVKVAAVTPCIRLADAAYNANMICEKIEEAYTAGARIIVFPELSLTGCTCGDLYRFDSLKEKARVGLNIIAQCSSGKKGLIFVGTPLTVEGTLYDGAAVFSDGKMLGFITAQNLPERPGYFRNRAFSKGPEEPFIAKINGKEIPIGPGLIFAAEGYDNIRVSAEIGADREMIFSPGAIASEDGACIIVNPCAFAQLPGFSSKNEAFAESISERLGCAYITVNAGEGESVTDLVFAGGSIIAENGKVLACGESFSTGIIYSEVDVQLLSSVRQKESGSGCFIPFDIGSGEVTLTRHISRYPFFPEDAGELKEHCREVFAIQAAALRRRLTHIHADKVVLGLSGGLDSTLALLAIVMALDEMGRDRSDCIAVTMPCFGTTDRTYNNACLMANALGVTLKEVSIKAAITQHLADIGHDLDNHNVAYENAQARERTQVLMDLANDVNGTVIGTGDLSELALGWATYNGDHMSMYGINGSIPKTQVRVLVNYAAQEADSAELKKALLDVLDTPVSPELIPGKDNKIVQKTEDIVGPYELHDFFIYYTAMYGMKPSKILRMAKYAFKDAYEASEIEKWLKVFIKRFTVQQFKRSCMPDGPAAGPVSFSPRGSLEMPSDAYADSLI